MSSRWAWLLCMLLVVVLAPVRVAHACRCREPHVSAAYREAALVLRGHVLSVDARPGSDLLQIRLRVAQAWKSDASAEISFVTATSCLYELAVGEEQLLFLARSAEGQLSTARCMGNATTAAATRQLAWLEKHGARTQVR